MNDVLGWNEGLQLFVCKHELCGAVRMLMKVSICTWTDTTQAGWREDKLPETWRE